MGIAQGWRQSGCLLLTIPPGINVVSPMYGYIDGPRVSGPGFFQCTYLTDYHRSGSVFARRVARSIQADHASSNGRVNKFR